MTEEERAQTVEERARENDLNSDSIEIRLQAARYFAAHARARHAGLLRESFGRESVPWIRRALEQAILRTESAGIRESISNGVREDVSGALANDLQAKAIEEVTGTILHEFAPIIGSVKMSASMEFPTFDGSRTQRLMNQLSELLSAIRNLRRSAAVPHFTEFDLSSLVTEAVTTANRSDINIRVGGAVPFLVRADRGSLQLALTNGLRNAVEAVSMWSRVSPPIVVINWGKAGAENFLVILDSGAGFVGNPADALKIGVSNKRDHIGYGLATAQIAMRAMQGEVLLSNSTDGGAKFEMRWYRDDAHPLN